VNKTRSRRRRIARLRRSILLLLWWIMDKGVTAEFFLDIGRRHGKPNGGTMIFLRSIWISIIVFFIALWLRSLFHARYPWTFVPSELFRNFPETLAWIGTIFAFTYLALYTRFASQFNYLAGVYNQIMATRSEIRGLAATEELRNPDNNRSVIAWQAGFIEDAEALHLATKTMFSTAIWFMLENRDIYDAYVEHTVHADKGARKLITSLKKSIGERELIRMRASRELRSGRPPTKPKPKPEPEPEKAPQHKLVQQTSHSDATNVGYPLTFACFAVGCAVGSMMGFHRSLR